MADLREPPTEDNQADAARETATETSRSASTELLAPFDLDPHFVATVVGAAGDHDRPLLRRLLLPLHPADFAAVLAQVREETFKTVVRLLGPDFPPEALAELSDELREEALELLPSDVVGRALGDLDTDDATAIVADLDEDDLEEVLAAAPNDVRLAIETNLAFDEETAGRLVQREFVAAPEFWTVGQSIDHMRDVADDLPDLFYEVYVVDPSFRPIGVVAASDLLRGRRAVALREIMEAPRILIRPEMDQEEVAFAFQKYSLISAPVVDEAGRLTGMITVDDIVHVIQEENKEDILALAGVNDANMADTVFNTVASRAPWLFVNLLTALAASFLISRFSGVLEQLVALAVLMPIVASMGGNTGTQTVAVVVRAMASRELTASNAVRIVGREIGAGLINGGMFATILAIVAWVAYHNPLISLTIGLATILNLTAGALAGILIPLALKRAGADPAVSSTVFVTFVTDMVGFCAFLGLASIIILGS